jgi:hypothetical protein
MKKYNCMIRYIILTVLLIIVIVSLYNLLIYKEGFLSISDKAKINRVHDYMSKHMEKPNSIDEIEEELKNRGYKVRLLSSKTTYLEERENTLIHKKIKPDYTRITILKVPERMVTPDTYYIG